MKKTLRSLLTITLISLALPSGISLTEAVTAATKQVRRCTPSTCTPYRANYERAIANRIIARPSLVPEAEQAIALADRAMARGDRNEVSRRLAQALVIISEKQGADSALAFERSLDADMKQKRGQGLRTYLPLFNRIFPPNRDPYR